MLLVAMAIGVMVSLFQAVTQVQEMSLTFVPKLIGVAAVLVVIAFWAIVAGIAQIVGAIRLRHEITDEWLLGLSGVLLLLFGLALIFQPVSGILSIVWLISLGSLVFGILTVMFAFKLRRYRA